MADKPTPSEVRTWDPFRDLDLFSAWPTLRGLPALRGEVERWLPSVDISESKESYVVTAELPGAKRDDITVELQEGVLTIRGTKRSEREEKTEERRYVERSFGSFTRSFTLPPNANGDEIKAKFAEGVLTVEIGKREEDKPKAIKVH
ncbi:MAG: Hsp20/alpha crystallin family protein [Myxococcota bacterium]|nr:Hsp20/alpha crystallin family protein [Myxococcales bacterium]